MNIRDYLALTTIKGFGAQKLIKLLRLKKTNEAQYQEKLKQHLCQSIDWQAVDEILAWQNLADNHHLLTWLDPKYPALLRQINSPPPLLYAKGELSILNNIGIAIIGSRQASQIGLENAYQFSQALSDMNYSIISGMAKGIDGSAHMGALNSNGKTIAVLGTGIDRVYPYQNKLLAQAIAARGLLLSEFPLNSPPNAYHFPQRNRIIAGLSIGVIVIEASLKSGSLITARLALEQGKEIFALPSSVHNPLAKGCHSLIKQGAKLVESIDDILEEFSTENQPKPTLNEQFVVKGLEKKGQNLVKFVGYELTSVNDILSNTELLPQQLSCQLVDLELQGAIKAVPGGYVRR